MHDRRARPTIRVLQEDLTSGWSLPLPLRQLAREKYEELHPLVCLPHPIIAKAASSFGADPSEDNYECSIRSSTQLPLLEIKSSQWRGGVWEDKERGVCWLIVAGLSKGDHLDWEDFYQRVERENKSGDPSRWLPSERDIRLLKRETAARIMTEWELEVQRSVRDALLTVVNGGEAWIEIMHPINVESAFARIAIELVEVREDEYEADEIALEIVPGSTYVGSNLFWRLILRVLISVSPPEQGWDRFKDTYSNIDKPGAFRNRLAQLDRLVAVGELAVSEPGAISHYAHRTHLADCTINGRAVRALCGVFFVPTQDHEAMPSCPDCEERVAVLP